MKIKKFPLVKPSIIARDIKEVGRVLRSGWFTQGRYVQKLERLIEDYNKIKHAFLLNSATSGLILSLKILNLNQKDEVIVPAFTFPATVNSVITSGAKPVFCDVDLKTFNISVENIAPLINHHTKAIIAVHQFGLSADIKNIEKICREHRLFLIEDAACSLGAEYKNRKTGTFGDMGIFSFHPRKIITSGEGGCIITKSDDFAKRISALRNHGEYNKRFIKAGFNFRMSDIQAALLFSQFKRLESIIAKRIKLALNYNRLLKPLAQECLLQLPLCPQNSRHTYQSYVLLLSQGIDRDRLIVLLKKEGIEVQIGTYCVPTLDYYRNNFSIPWCSYQNSFFTYKHSLTLPLYHDLRNSEQEFIVGKLRKLVKKCAV